VEAASVIYREEVMATLFSIADLNEPEPHRRGA